MWLRSAGKGAYYTKYEALCSALTKDYTLFTVSLLFILGNCIHLWRLEGLLIDS
jgi:hypothetical protein